MLNKYIFRNIFTGNINLLNTNNESGDYTYDVVIHVINNATLQMRI